MLQRAHVSEHPCQIYFASLKISVLSLQCIDYERKDRLLPRIEDLQTFMNRQLVWQLSGNLTLSQLYLLYPPDATWNTQKNLN